MNRSPVVTDECWEYYKTLNNSSPDTLRVIEHITQNPQNNLSNLASKSTLLPIVCSTINTQKAAHDQWIKGIKTLDTQLDGMLSAKVGGGALECPEDFQKIFNYMFLIAASSSIAIMSPDIELVTNVCMKTIQLVFGTIALPILNLLRVIFIFMIQSLVLIIKTAGTLAIQLISNFIKTVYLNINTIASGLVGITKVFIYKSLTYCKSFYNSVASHIHAEKTKVADVTDLPKGEPVISMPIEILKGDIVAINQSMNAAIRGEVLYPDITISSDNDVIEDIFGTMLTKFSDSIDNVRDNIIYCYTFLKTAYMLLCDKTHAKITKTLGSTYNTNQKKLLITKALINAEIAFVKLLNVSSNTPTIVTYYFKAAFLRILQVINEPRSVLFDDADFIEERVKRSKRSRSLVDEEQIIDEINNIMDKIKETDLKNAVLDNNLTDAGKSKIDDVDAELKKLLYPDKPVVGKLNESKKYIDVMNHIDAKLQEIVDRNDSPPNFGGARKRSNSRKTKKSKTRRNKTCYSRKP